MRLSILIPCYNEENTIRTLLSHLFSQHISVDFEVILVDDGSKVRLKPIIQDFLVKYHNLRYYRLKKNSGKGTAIRFAILKSQFEYLLIQDADLEYNPKDIPEMIETLENHQNAVKNHRNVVIYGSRFLKMPKGMSNAHFFGNKILTAITNKLYNTHLTDMETGYKLFPKKIIDLNNFKVTNFEIEPVLTTLFLKNHQKIIEIPITYHYRLKGNAKIHIGDGIQALFVLFKNRYLPQSNIAVFLYQIYSHYFKKLIGLVSKIIKFEMK